MIRRIAATIVAALLTAGTVTTTTSQPVDAGIAPWELPAKFVPADTPCRLVDSREHPWTAEGGKAVVLTAHNECGIPESATSLVVSAIAVGPEADGHLSVIPSALDKPTTSNVNYKAGETRANTAIIRLTGNSQTFKVFSHATTDIVVDVNGWFIPSFQSKDGRYQSITATRVLDTRETAAPQPGKPVRVTAPIPDGASAVAINVTTVSDQRDHITVWPAGQRKPNASVLNTDGAQQVRAAFTVVGVNETQFNVASYTGQHIIVDVVGYFTGDDAQPGRDGLYQAAAFPYRAHDSRTSALGPVEPGETRRLGNWVGAGSAAALVGNVTAVRSFGRGHWTMHPSTWRTEWIGTSSLNSSKPDETVANFAFTTSSGSGVSVYSFSGGDVVYDVVGAFTGKPLNDRTNTFDSGVIEVPKAAVSQGIVFPENGKSFMDVAPLIDQCIGAAVIYGGFDTLLWLGAHRTHCGNRGFGGIETLEPGDVVHLVAADGTRVPYSMTEKVVVDRHSPILPSVTRGQPELVLQTSYNSQYVYLVTFHRQDCPGVYANLQC